MDSRVTLLYICRLSTLQVCVCLCVCVCVGHFFIWLLCGVHIKSHSFSLAFSQWISKWICSHQLLMSCTIVVPPEDLHQDSSCTIVVSGEDLDQESSYPIVVSGEDLDQGPYSQRILGLKVGPNWRI